jgi:hypothetical protein
MSSSGVEKTLVFCTAYASPSDFYYSWDVRYRIWIEAIRRSSLVYDQILLVDDGSAELPGWNDVKVIHDSDGLLCGAPLVIRHFGTSLGRPRPGYVPGWVRSFFSVAQYAEINGFTKIIHLEADAFLITQRAVDYVNGLHDGWSTVWCARHQWPESALQVVAGSGLRAFRALAEKPVEEFAGACIEWTLPFTYVERDLMGDRYGEEGRKPPRAADWCSQAAPPKFADYYDYFWFLPWLKSVFPNLAAQELRLEIDRPSAKMKHEGLYYLDWLKEAEPIMEPRMYFEVGTHAGDSIKMIGCDAVCVDPNFVITTDVLLRRRHTHFFQGTADAFFADRNTPNRLFPNGIDLAFLDGLHFFEVLLRDFINTEKFTKPGSLILLHDCLPLNTRMAERERRDGGEDEPPDIRDFWTGDVWKVVPIIARFRPDITISYLDCGPTGLVACTGLDPTDTTLTEHFEEILPEFQDLTLQEFGLERLWDLFPTYNSIDILADSQVFESALFRPVGRIVSS